MAIDIAPAKGIFVNQISDLAEGAKVPAKSNIGVIKTLRDEIPIDAPHGGTIIEWLAQDGDPVAPGQPLLRLHPLTSEK